MKSARLGSTGLKVSRACLGTMTFGLQCNEPTSFAIMDKAAESGVNFIDTADAYPLGGTWETAGRSEEIVGRWLKNKRDRFIVATKCWGQMGPELFQEGLSRKHILDAIDESLRRLGTDYVDLYQLHHPDSSTSWEESLGALNDIVRAGKARYIGVSNFPAWETARALGKSDARGLERFVCVQPRYNLLFRENEREMFPLCEAEGLGVISYNPLAGGLLTGKHANAAAPSTGRFSLGTAAKSYQDRYWQDREFGTVTTLTEVAARHSMKLTTMAIQWVLANPVVTAPILGASQPEQLNDVLAAFESAMSSSLVSELNDLTHVYRLGDAPR